MCWLDIIYVHIFFGNSTLFVVALKLIVSPSEIALARVRVHYACQIGYNSLLDHDMEKKSEHETTVVCF